MSETPEVSEDIMQAATAVCRTLSRTPLKDEALVIARAIQAERNRSKWQDISTAPKDGSNILSWADDWYGFHIVAWNEDEGLWADGTWCFRTGPTHWMPMEPPDLPADDPEAKP